MWQLHSLTWLSDVPDVEQDLATQISPLCLQRKTSFRSTINPAILPDGSSVDVLRKTNPHILDSEMEDFSQDLADLIATCQRHTRCSAAYCLRTHNGQPKCGIPNLCNLKQLLLQKMMMQLLETMDSSTECMACKCGHAILCVTSQSH